MFERMLKVAGGSPEGLGFFGGYEYDEVKDKAKSLITDTIGNGAQVQNLVKTTITGTPDPTGAKVDPSAPAQAQPNPAQASDPKQVLTQDLKNQTINNLPKGLGHLARGEYGDYAKTVGQGFISMFGDTKTAGSWWETAAAVASPAVAAYDMSRRTIQYGQDLYNKHVAPAVENTKQEIGGGIAKGLVGSPLMQTAGKQIASGITDGILGQEGIASEYGGSFGRAMAHGAIGDFKGMMGVITGPASQTAPVPPVGPVQQPK